MREKTEEKTAEGRRRVAERIRDFGAGLWRAHRPLAALTFGATIMLLTCLGLELVDPRQVGGASTWLKPAKFAASIATTAPMLAWILGQMVATNGRRARRLHRAGIAIAMLATLELAIIAIQAARGVPSHFNSATRVDATLFAVMGVGISMLWLCELYIAGAAFRRPFASATRAWGIRLGLSATLLGGALGALMTRPTPAQRDSLAAGRPTPMVGAHAVGVVDGGPGIAVTRWSPIGGDLRVPHFLGLHGLQGLPIAAWLVERRRRKQGLTVLAAAGDGAGPAPAPAPDRGGPVVAVGAAWIGLTLVTLFQALRGQSVMAPDRLTSALAIAVVGVAFAIHAVTARAAREGAQEPGGPGEAGAGELVRARLGV